MNAEKEEKGNKVHTGQTENTQDDKFKPEHSINVHFLLLHGSHSLSQQHTHFLSHCVCGSGVHT